MSDRNSHPYSAATAKPDEELKTDLPNNSLFSRVDEIFQTWFETVTNASLVLPSCVLPKRLGTTLNVYYESEYDDLLYRSTTYMEKYYSLSSLNNNLCIKLANDYNNIKELSTLRRAPIKSATIPTPGTSCTSSILGSCRPCATLPSATLVRARSRWNSGMIFHNSRWNSRCGERTRLQA